MVIEHDETGIRVSIHAPLEGRDLGMDDETYRELLFQSTRPRRGAISLGSDQALPDDVSIHAPPEGRDF